MKKITLLFAATLLTLSVAAQQRYQSLRSAYQGKVADIELNQNLKAFDMAPQFAAKKIEKQSFTDLLQAPELQKVAKKSLAKRDKAAPQREIFATYMDGKVLDTDWNDFADQYMQDRTCVLDADTLMFPIMQYASGGGIYAYAYRQGKSNLFDTLDVDSFIVPRRFVDTLTSGKEVYVSGLTPVARNQQTGEFTFALKDSIVVYYFPKSHVVFVPEILGLVSEDLSFQMGISYRLEFTPQESLDPYMLNAITEFSYIDSDVTLAGDTIDAPKTLKKLTKCLYYDDYVYIKDLSFTSAYNDLGAWMRLTPSTTTANVYELENMQYIISYQGVYGVYNYGVTAQGRLADGITFMASALDDGSVLFEQFGANYYYELMFYKGSPIAFYSSDQLRFTILNPEVAPYQTITLDECGYGTFGDENVSYQAPEDLKVLYVTGMNEKGLVYADAPQNVILAGEGVLLKSVSGKGGEFNLTVVDTTEVKVKYGPNALYPSSFVDQVYDYYGDKTNEMFLFYKFTYNNNTREKLGWFWGAQNGNYFYNDRGKAVLMLRKSSGSRISDNFLINDEEEVNGISTVAMKADNQNVYFNMQGVRVAKPQQKGLYIINNKKVIIK